MNIENKSLALIFFIALLFYIGVGILGNIAEREFWGDEAHFYETVLLFESDFSIETLNTYNEMSTPIPFVLYALWGKLFGTGLFTLRIFSIMISILVMLTVHAVLLKLNIRIKTAIFGTLFFMINPYVIGLSIFVFTDMLAILFLVLSFYMLLINKPWWMALVLACAILSRQYMLFFVLPVIIFSMINKSNHENSLNNVWAAVVSVIPYLMLVVLWGGTSPDNSFKLIYIDESFVFHPNWIVLYIGMIYLYLLPYSLRLFYTRMSIRIVIASLIISSIYVVFPVYTSQYSIDVGVETVGLAHKAFRYLGTNTFIDQIIFYLLFLLGLPIMITFAIESYNRIKAKTYDTTVLLDLLLFSFLLTMSFSYLCWEKYLIPIIPFLIFRFSLMLKEGGLDSQAD